MNEARDDIALGLVGDPSEDWPNDDLLLREDSRTRLALHHPALLKVLDWPALRDEFARHDAPADLARKHCRRHGVWAVLCGGVGLVLAAVTPVLAIPPWLPGPAVGLAAVGFTVLGAVLGGLHWIGSRHRSIWLFHRFWTERLRQFYFQFLIHNIELAGKAVTDKRALERYEAARARALEILVTDTFHDVPSLIEDLEQDRAESQPWLVREWKEPQKPITGKTQETDLLEALRRQRILVQERYTSINLRDNFSSPKFRANAVRSASDLLTLAVVVLAIVTGALLVSEQSLVPFSVSLSLSASAALSAAVVILRVLDEGLQLRVDTERYEWYLAAIKALDERFRYADATEKVTVLEEFEHLSYQEFRRFLVSHLRARFLL